MVILSLLFLCVVATGIFYFTQKNRVAQGNRYRKTKRITPRTTEDEPVESHNNDFDDVLDVKLPETTVSADAKSVDPKNDCVVVMYLMAPEGCSYAGYELLQSLLSAGLRYGKQHIFNRHVHKDGRGEILFHCASATQPGTFDLTKMGTFSSLGLCFFFSASSVQEPLSTFDCMLETIDQLVEDLGGQVLDEKRELFTKEKMVNYRQQLRSLEKQLVADLL